MVIICGSFAYDCVMEFDDKFHKHLLPDQLHNLNISFLVSKMRKEYGGCAGNIAYNLKLLNEDPFPMGTVGIDFEPYAKWMDKCKIKRDFITEIKDIYTAQAFITTDNDKNQITIFHPGAMNFSHINKIEKSDNIKLGIISPDGRQGMIDHADQFAKANIPFIFDPGQGLPMFEKDDLIHFLELASWICLNEYESELLQSKTQINIEQIMKMVKALIITKAGKGSIIYTKDKTYNIEIAKTTTILDPTGCGDAYRAGIIYGLLHDLDWDTTGKIASLMGTYKIEKNGTQNHSFEFDEFKKRLYENFGCKI